MGARVNILLSYQCPASCSSTTSTSSRCLTRLALGPRPDIQLGAGILNDTYVAHFFFCAVFIYLFSLLRYNSDLCAAVEQTDFHPSFQDVLSWTPPGIPCAKVPSTAFYSNKLNFPFPMENFPSGTVGQFTSKKNFHSMA